jgi:tetratricopeptide (TPR) repeat protein
MAKEGSNLQEDLTSMLDFDVNALLSGGDPTGGSGGSNPPNDTDPIQDTIDDGKQVTPPGKKEENFDINKFLDSSLQTDEGSKKETKQSVADKTGEPHAPQNTENTPSSLVTFSLAKDLLERGLISELVEEDAYQKLVEETGDEYEALAKVLEDNLYKEKEYIVNNLEEDIQTYIKLRDLGVDSETVNRLASTQFKLEKLTDAEIEGDENLEMRRLLLTQYYKKTSPLMDEDEIKGLVEAKIDTGKDIEAAKQAKIKLLKINKDEMEAEAKAATDAKLAAEQNYKQQQVKFKQMVENIQDIFPDAKLTKVQKNELENMVMKAVTQDANGKPVNAVWNEYFKDPLKFQLAIAYHIKNGTLFGKAVTSTKTAEKKALQNLKEKLDSGRNNLGVALDVAQLQSTRGFEGITDKTANNLKEMKEAFGLK